jgi:hypothetical protein
VKLAACDAVTGEEIRWSHLMLRTEEAPRRLTARAAAPGES